jgi:hypothetical protein
MGVMMKMMMQGVSMQRGEKGGDTVKMLAATPAVIRRKKEVRNLLALLQVQERGAQFTCFYCSCKKEVRTLLALLELKCKY